MVKEFYFRSYDGLTNIHSIKWIPDSGKCRAILQISHGMVEFIEKYDETARFMNENDIMVVGHDHLGHGGSIQTKENWGYFCKEKPCETLVEDMNSLRKIIQKEYPDIPYFMLGHSMGSYMLRRYLCQYSEGLSGAVIVGTGYVSPFVTRAGIILIHILACFYGWKHRSRFVASLAFSGSYKQFDMSGKDLKNSWLTKDEEILKRYLNEPRSNFSFTLNGYLGLLQAVNYDTHLFNMKTIPKDLHIMLASGSEDPVGDMGKGVTKTYEMYRKSGLNNVKMKLYDNDRHEILNETDRYDVYNDIIKYIFNSINYMKADRNN